MPQNLKPRVFAGTATMFFAAVNLIKVPPYFLLGQFSRENLAASLALMPLAVLSTFAGVWIVRRIDALFEIERARNKILVQALQMRLIPFSRGEEFGRPFRLAAAQILQQSDKIGPEGVLDALRYTLIFKAENENGDERAKVFERAAASLARYTETFVSNYRGLCKNR